MKKTRSVVLLSIAAAGIAIAGLAFAVPALGEEESGLVNRSTVTYSPVQSVINGVPVTVFVGSYTGNRAVIQLSTRSSAGRELFESIRTAQLRTERGTIPGAVTTGRLANETWTLTIEFSSNRPIGEATLVVRTPHGTYSFSVAWPPTPGV